MSRDPLHESFLRTTYIVHAPDGPVRLRIGAFEPALDRLLERHGAAEWTFITAWNPGARPLPRQENLARNEELRLLLRSRGFQPVPAEGAGDDGSWEPEESFWVAGLGADEGTELGRRFGQAAIVAGTAGDAPRLCWCDRGIDD